MTIAIVVGMVIGKQRGRFSVALHRGRSGSWPDRARVPELDHGSLRTESQLCILGFPLLLLNPFPSFAFAFGLVCVIVYFLLCVEGPFLVPQSPCEFFFTDRVLLLLLHLKGWKCNSIEMSRAFSSFNTLLISYPGTATCCIYKNPQNLKLKPLVNQIKSPNLKEAENTLEKNELGGEAGFESIQTAESDSEY